MSEDSANNVFEYVQPHLPDDVGYPGLVEKGMCPQPTYHAIFDAIDRRGPLDVKPPAAKHVRAIQRDLEDLFHEAFDRSLGDVDVAGQVFINSRMFRLMVTSAYNADCGIHHPQTRDVLGKLYFEDDYKSSPVVLTSPVRAPVRTEPPPIHADTSEIINKAAQLGLDVRGTAALALEETLPEEAIDLAELDIPDLGLLGDDDMTSLLAHMFRVPIHELKLDDQYSTYLDKATSLARITNGQTYFVQVFLMFVRFLRNDGVLKQADDQTPVWVRKLKERLLSSQADRGFSDEELQKRLFDRNRENRLDNNKNTNTTPADGEEGMDAVAESKEAFQHTNVVNKVDARVDQLVDLVNEILEENKMSVAGLSREMDGKYEASNLRSILNKKRAASMELVLELLDALGCTNTIEVSRQPLEPNKQ